MKFIKTEQYATSQPRIQRILLKEGSIVKIVVLSSLSSLLAMVVPVLTGRFIDCISKANASIYAWALLLLAMSASLCMELFNRWYSSKQSLHLKLCLQHALAEEFASINPGKMDAFMHGELAAKFIRDTDAIASIVRDIVSMATMAIVGLACAFCISFVRSLSIGIMMAILAVICTIVLLRFSQGIAVANRNNRTAMDHCMSILVEMITNFPGLKAMSAASLPLSRMSASFECANSAGWNLDKQNLKFEGTVKSIMFLGEAIVLSVAGWMAFKGILTVGDVIVFQMLFAQTLGSIANVFRIMPLFGYVNEAAISIGELTQFEGKERDCGKLKFSTFNGRVQLRDVSFAYGIDGRKVLDGIFFDLNEKECCALVGANGSGKTTLAKLVGAFSEPNNGTVFFDDIDLRRIDRESLRTNISFLFQDPMVFSGTIRENITLGKEFSDEEFRWAIDVCGLRDYANKHAEGYDYRITSANALSGGERQRIAAARALIRKPKLMILDEPGNHIDAIGFSCLKKFIECAKCYSSILLITHDKSLAAIADRVVSIEKTERN